MKVLPLFVSTYRKESGHFFKSFVTNLTEAISASTPTITSQSLIQARSLLHPLPHPLTLDYTRGIIDRLPNDWVYCVCVMKEIVKGDHSIIIVRIKNDKDPILVKIRLKPDKVCNIIYIQPYMCMYII